ncbi:toxin-antitoxin system YwqK family antitoxin [Ancylomarina sp. YFZ004]
MKRLLFIFSIFLLFACESKPTRETVIINEDGEVLEGWVKKYNSKNKLRSETFYKNGIREGAARVFYDSGELSDEVFYVGDELHGMAKKYHKNGQVYSLTPYVNDKKDGIQKKFFPNGKIWAETPYKRGKAGIGLKEYKRNGSLRKTFPSIECQQFVRSDRVNFKMFLNNYSRNVEFYITPLVQNKYIPIGADVISAEKGSGKIDFFYSKGQVLDTVVNVVAKYRTSCRNIYVVQKEIRIKNN